MTSKGRRGVVFALVLMLLVTSSSWSTPAYAAASLEKNVLLIYESRYFYSDARDVVLVIDELLGHYQTQVTTMSVDELDDTEKPSLKDYDVVIYLTLDRLPSKEGLIEALKTYEGQIFWLGRGLDVFLKETNYQMAYKGILSNLLNIRYKKSLTGLEQTFDIGVQRTFYNIEPTDDRVEVDSWLSDGVTDYPFILRDQNLVFISRVDINEPLFYIFADYLSNFFTLKKYSEDELLVSIEDVNVFSDYDKVKALIDYCYANSIPFTMGVIPQIVQEGTDYITNFYEVADFVELLKYAQSHGGSLVLHLYPHEVKEGDFVIYDQSDEYATKQDQLEAYLETVLNDMIENDLYPIGYQSTHANLSSENYAYLKEHFSTTVGQMNINESNIVVYPYILYDTDRFNQYLPLNLGYVDPNDQTSFGLIHDRLDKIGLVNGFFSGVYFHSSLDVKYLDALIKELDDYHLKYYDAKALTHYVSNDTYEVRFDRGDVSIIKLKEEIPETFAEKGIRIMGDVIMYFLILVFIVFILLFLRSRSVTRDKLFKE